MVQKRLLFLTVLGLMITLPTLLVFIYNYKPPTFYWQTRNGIFFVPPTADSPLCTNHLGVRIDELRHVKDRYAPYVELSLISWEAPDCTNFFTAFKYLIGL